MNLAPASAQRSKRGPSDYFTGIVWLDDLATAATGSAVKVARVTFEPRARTAWHTHPHGQLLHVLSGFGRIQKADGPIKEVRPGDTVWFEPGERHWHGAGPETAMVHLAVQQADAAGSAATWFEHVSETDYGLL